MTARAERSFGSNGARPTSWRNGSLRSLSFRVRAHATKHPNLLSLQRSRRTGWKSGSLACTGTTIYLKIVAGFAPQDGAWRTIDGRLQLGRQDQNMAASGANAKSAN